jgi:hypothetical protein
MLRAYAEAHADLAKKLRHDELHYRNEERRAAFTLKEAEAGETSLANGDFHKFSPEESAKLKRRAEARLRRAQDGWGAACYSRKVHNRQAARVVHLTRAFLSGKPFERVERVSYQQPNLVAAFNLALEHGEGARTDTGNVMTRDDIKQQFWRWAEGCTFRPTRENP